MTRCATCGGTYDGAPAAGVPYLHRCPPLSEAEVKTAMALSQDDTKLTAVQLAAVRAADRTRANTRDENITSTAPTKTGAPMKSAGAGVTTVP